ncbi:hypothetical protein [Mycolicibacterium litorale]|uniref:hypothetical protein n=1 Tax=Mycolicibacterium litorale TaxID=758802 RepID=UPI001065E215|nr:hypothetical protein [Mycolicibacterium litorale]MCV7415520.1 hypothetical protein [Mycolicibacterium litorale]
MTQPADAAARYPAPGSPVPGAPPPLKRTLTPADGAAVSPESGSPRGGTTNPPRGYDDSRRESGRSRWTAAAAMVGIAAGLELAGVLARRSTGVKC